MKSQFENVWSLIPTVNSIGDIVYIYLYVCTYLYIQIYKRINCINGSAL